MLYLLPRSIQVIYLDFCNMPMNRVQLHSPIQREPSFETLEVTPAAAGVRLNPIGGAASTCREAHASEARLNAVDTCLEVKTIGLSVALFSSTLRRLRTKLRVSVATPWTYTAAGSP